MVKTPKKMKAGAPMAGAVRIAFSSAGKDFHLEVRGGDLGECEKAFERLFNKVKCGPEHESSHYG